MTFLMGKESSKQSIYKFFISLMRKNIFSFFQITSDFLNFRIFMRHIIRIFIYEATNIYVFRKESERLEIS